MSEEVTVESVERAFSRQAVLHRLGEGEARNAIAADLLGQVSAVLRAESDTWIDQILELAKLRESLARGKIPEVAFFGGFNAGKSSTINALLGENLANVGATPSQIKITFYRQGASERYRVKEQGVWTTTTRDFCDRMVHDAPLSGAERTRLAQITAIEVQHPKVRDDMVLVDTPGFLNTDEDDDTAEKQWRSTAACVYVVAAQKGGLQAQDLRLLARLSEGKLPYAVLNQADTMPPSKRAALLADFRQRHGSRFADVFLFSAKMRIKRDGGAAHVDTELLDLDWDERIVPIIAASLERAEVERILDRGRATLANSVHRADTGLVDARAKLEELGRQREATQREIARLLTKLGADGLADFQKGAKELCGFAARCLIRSRSNGGGGSGRAKAVSLDGDPLADLLRSELVGWRKLGTKTDVWDPLADLLRSELEFKVSLLADKIVMPLERAFQQVVSETLQALELGADDTNEFASVESLLRMATLGTVAALKHAVFAATICHARTAEGKALAQWSKEDLGDFIYQCLSARTGAKELQDWMFGSDQGGAEPRDKLPSEAADREPAYRFEDLFREPLRKFVQAEVRVAEEARRWEAATAIAQRFTKVLRTVGPLLGAAL